MKYAILFALCLVACVSTPRGIAAGHLKACLYDAEASNGKGRLYCQARAEQECQRAGLDKNCAATQVSEDAFWECMDAHESAAREPDPATSQARMPGFCR